MAQPLQPPRLAHLQSLQPTELTQLVLQFLEPSSKMKAARCSRTMRLRASAPFAWKHTPVCLRAATMAATRVTFLNASSLLRHAPLHVVYDWPSRDDSVLPPLLTISTFPRLHTLEIHEDAMFSTHAADVARNRRDATEDMRCNLLELLRSPSVQRVKVLIINGNINSSIAFVISRLPALESLTLRRAGDVLGLHGTLASSPVQQLTRLSLTDTRLNASRYAQCKYLRFLELRYAVFVPGAFFAMCYGCPALEQLVLHTVAFGSPLRSSTDREPDSAATHVEMEAEFAAGCAALTQLQELVLQLMLPDVAKLFPHLVLCPRLQRLWFLNRAFYHSSPSHFYDLQQAAPRLQILFLDGALHPLTLPAASK